MPKGTLNEIHSLFPFQGRKENNFPSKARLFKFVFIPAAGRIGLILTVLRFESDWKLNLDLKFTLLPDCLNRSAQAGNDFLRDRQSQTAAA